MARDVSWRVPERRLFSTPIPEETRTYKPVSHKELATATLRAINDAGFELGVEEYYTAKMEKLQQLVIQLMIYAMEICNLK